jgi:hypothetical protein
VRAGAIPSAPLPRCIGSCGRFGSGSPHPSAAVSVKTARCQMTAGEPEAQAAPRRVAPPPTGIRPRAWDATANGSPGVLQACTPTFPPSNGRAGAKSPPPAPSESRSDTAGAPARLHRRQHPRQKLRSPTPKPRKNGSFAWFYMRKPSPANQAPISIRGHCAKLSKIPLACCAFLRRVCPVDSKSAVQNLLRPGGRH